MEEAIFVSNPSLYCWAELDLLLEEDEANVH
jgi:hypothetical protein